MSDSLKHFILKEDGEVYFIQEMPDEKTFEQVNGSNYHYLLALTKAKENAIKVENKDEIKLKLFQKHKPEFDGFENWFFKKDNVYSLECDVRVKEIPWRDGFSGTVLNYSKLAIVTFTAEENDIDKAVAEYCRKFSLQVPDPWCYPGDLIFGNIIFEKPELFTPGHEPKDVAEIRRRTKSYRKIEPRELVEFLQWKEKIQKHQDQLWDEVIDTIKTSSDELYFEDQIKYIKEKFTITHKRQ